MGSDGGWFLRGFERRCIDFDCQRLTARTEDHVKLLSESEEELQSRKPGKNSPTAVLSDVSFVSSYSLRELIGN